LPNLRQVATRQSGAGEPNVKYKCELNAGVAYVTSMTPLIEAIEQAALSAEQVNDAIEILNSLKNAVWSIEFAIYKGEIGKKEQA
jgi:hypothetical protein